MTLPADEILICGCGRELAYVEIAGRPTLAHTTNPTFQHHYPRLSRTADGRRSSARVGADRGDNHRQSEVPGASGVSSQRTNGTRAASDGRPRTANPSEAPALRESGRPELPPVRSMPWAASTRPGSPSAGPRS